MKITVISPAAKQSRSGNRVTAVRWAHILRDLGHRVSIDTERGARNADMMVAIHAYRSAQAIRDWAQAHSERALVVLLAGTDIYRFAHSHPEPTHASMRVAHRLVGLHDFVGADIPTQFSNKLRIIYQSSLPLPQPRKPSRRNFDICVVGHLRDEKDPLCAAQAARLLPSASRVRIVHYGKAHTAQWAQAARDEMAVNKRYLWRDEVPRGEIRRAFGRCQAMVISSVMEGGANVVSEAIVAGLPVLASDISGNRGLLGDEHPACYPVQDRAALAQLMWRAESQPGFLPTVQASATRRAHLFTPQRERAAWAQLLSELR